MEKVYGAVVLLSAESYPLALEGRKREITLTDWILRNYSGNSALVVEAGTRDAKRAQLTFRTLEIRDGKALLEIHLLTGRHHQIRVQMAHAGMLLFRRQKVRRTGSPEEGKTAQKNKERRTGGPCACALPGCASRIPRAERRMRVYGHRTGFSFRWKSALCRCRWGKVFKHT